MLNALFAVDVVSGPGLTPRTASAVQDGWPAPGSRSSAKQNPFSAQAGLLLIKKCIVDNAILSHGHLYHLRTRPERQL